MAKGKAPEDPLDDSEIETVLASLAPVEDESPEEDDQDDAVRELDFSREDMSVLRSEEFEDEDYE